MLTRRALLASAFAPTPRALRLHRDALVFDAHIHMVNRQFFLGGDMGQRVENGQMDLVRAREGGLDALFFSLWVNEQYYPARYETKQVFRLFDHAQKQLDANRQTIEVAYGARDIERLAKAGKLAAFLDLEGGFDLDGDLGILRELHRRGLRSLQLPAHNWANHFAESCCAAGPVKGLNERGRAVVKEMNRLRMVINVSHGSDATIEQTIALSELPVIATHHGLRSFNDIPRTMSEKMLETLVKRRGVIGFQIGCEFHSRAFFELRRQMEKKNFWDTSEIGRREKDLPIEEVDKLAARIFPSVGIDVPEEKKLTPEEWLKPVARAIEIGGEDCVCLGSDFDGGPTPARGIRDVSHLPVLTQAMLNLGWSETRIRKFLGLNLLRHVREVTGV